MHEYDVRAHGGITYRYARERYRGVCFETHTREIYLLKFDNGARRCRRQLLRRQATL